MLEVKARFAFTHGAFVFKRGEVKSLPAEVAMALERGGQVDVLARKPSQKKRAARTHV